MSKLSWLIHETCLIHRRRIKLKRPKRFRRHTLTAMHAASKQAIHYIHGPRPSAHKIVVNTSNFISDFQGYSSFNLVVVTWLTGCIVSLLLEVLIYIT